MSSMDTTDTRYMTHHILTHMHMTRYQANARCCVRASCFEISSTPAADKAVMVLASICLAADAPCSEPGRQTYTNISFLVELVDLCVRTRPAQPAAASGSALLTQHCSMYASLAHLGC